MIDPTSQLFYALTVGLELAPDLLQDMSIQEAVKLLASKGYSTEDVLRMAEPSDIIWGR